MCFRNKKKIIRNIYVKYSNCGHFQIKCFVKGGLLLLLLLANITYKIYAAGYKDKGFKMMPFIMKNELN